MCLRVVQKDLKFDNFKHSKPRPEAPAELLSNINIGKYEEEPYFFNGNPDGRDNFFQLRKED